MKHAILIAAHRSPALLRDLIDAVATPRTHVFVHVDFKAPFTPADLLPSLAKPDCVTMIGPRSAVSWGGYSTLAVELRLLRTARGSGSYVYYHLLSGQCFPTRPIAQILEAFEAEPGREHIECFRLPTERWEGGGLSRLQYYHLHDRINVRRRILAAPVNRMIVNGLVDVQRLLGLRRPLPGDFSEYYGGSAFWSLTESSVDHVLQYLDDHPSVELHLRSTFCPDEILFQTLIANSYLADRITGENLRYIDWTFRNGNIPANLDESDFDAIVQSPAMFARKFDIEHSSMLRERLRERR